MRLVMPYFLHFEPAPDLDYDGKRQVTGSGVRRQRDPHFIDLLFLRTKRPPREFWHYYVRSMKKSGSS